MRDYLGWGNLGSKGNHLRVDQRKPGKDWACQDPGEKFRDQPSTILSSFRWGGDGHYWTWKAASWICQSTQNSLNDQWRKSKVDKKAGESVIRKILERYKVNLMSWKNQASFRQEGKILLKQMWLNDTLPFFCCYFLHLRSQAIFMCFKLFFVF